MSALVVALALLATACNSDTPAEPTGQPSTETDKRYETTIKSSRELGTLKTRVGEEEFAGVQCSTCHSIPADGDTPAEHPDELEDFHTGMEFAHSDLTCNSCHNPNDRNTLRLADGKSLAFEDTRHLCAQCHGPQHRDYINGSHGGMNGYWDLNQGPRTRNDCVNCHDPHDPSFKPMMPAPGPRDGNFGKEKH
ncbi:MAG: hypothetical protein ACOC9J_01025 [Persicimonas sp.]